MILLKKLAIAIALMSGSIALQAQLVAFPGAEGFGRFATGGRGGEVYHVTNLNDSGTDSLRDAVSKSNRIVVFDVGGVINIDSRIVIQKNIYIAGQTAPGGGITIYGNGVALNSSSGNLIMRYIRIRMGENGDYRKDALGISDGQNYLFDNVSVSWGWDGTLDVNGSNINNITFQDCIISQGIDIVGHSTGGLMQSGKWSMIRSLYIDNNTRNPKGKGVHEVINCTIYNWGTDGYIMGASEGISEVNCVGNYFIYGPSSGSGSHITRTSEEFHVYPKDNWVDANKNGVLDGTLMTDYKTATVMTSPYDYDGMKKVMPAKDALNYLIKNVGASMPRDAVDNFLIDQLVSYGKKGAIIKRESDNGIPGNVGTVASGIAPIDTDKDGMPDTWESNRGLNPAKADNNGDDDGDGYTNIEEYLSCMAGDVDCSTTKKDFPVVTLTAPATGITVPTTATISFKATATDADGTIAKVEFYRGTTLIGTGTASGSTYTLATTGLPAGTLTITAKATDNAGNATTSAAITILVVPPKNYVYNHATTDLWTNTVNWTPAALPTSIDTAVIRSGEARLGQDFGGLTRVEASGILRASAYINLGTVELLGGAIKINSSSQTLGMKTNLVVKQPSSVIAGSNPLTLFTIDGTISGSANLTKKDLGIVMLKASAANFNGMWIVEQDTLSVASANGLGQAGAAVEAAGVLDIDIAASTNVLTINKGGKLNLDANLTVQTAVFDGANIPAGTYTATDYPAVLSGSGSLTVLSCPACVTSKTQTIQLQKGWNLISINLRPTDSTIATLFKGLDVQEIKDMGAFWRKDQNEMFNSLKTITPGEGYLVNMNTAGTLMVAGTPIVETHGRASLPTNGWQLIGCPYPAAAPIVGILGSTFLEVKNFEGFNIPNGTNNSIENIEPGKGYFVQLPVTNK